MADFEWYRSFIAVYRAGTVTGAARTRHLTQPAISQHLSGLEAACGVMLFERTPRRMIPTEDGKRLYSRLILAIEQLEKTSDNLKNSFDLVHSPLRVGTPLEYFQEVILAKSDVLHKRWHIEFGDAESLIKKLESDELDVVIATQKIPTKGIEFTKLTVEEFCMIAPPDLVVPKKKNMKDMAQSLTQLNWISYSVQLPIIRRYWQQVFKQRPTIEPILVIPNLIAIRKAIESGHGVSILPRYLCEASLKSGKLRVLWDSNQTISNEIWIAYRKVDRTRLDVYHLSSLLS